jgi:hypothetical protein
MIEATTIKAPKPAGALAWSADNTPRGCEGVSSLYSWSSNYSDFAPFRKFLDLIGYSMEEFGSNLCSWDNPADSLGFVEIGHLAEALTNYADRPRDVEAFVQELLLVESDYGL